MDFSDDIRVFRNMVERSLSPKLYLLDNELNRLRSLPDKCLEEFAIKIYGKRHYKNPGFWGNLKAHGLDIIEGLDKFFKLIQGDNLPYDWYDEKSHYQQRIEEAKAHEEELKQITKEVTDFCDRVRRNFVLDSTLKYSERKQFYALLDDKMYGSDAIHLLSKNDMLRFLLSIAEMEAPQKEAILESLSKCAGFSFRDAVLANDVTAIESYFEKLNDRYYPFAFEVSSLAYGLQDTNTIYFTIEKILEVCRRITPKYYIKFENAVKALPANLNTLCPDLNISLQQRLSLFTPEEVDAIQGVEEKDKAFTSEQQDETRAPEEPTAGENGLTTKTKCEVITGRLDNLPGIQSEQDTTTDATDGQEVDAEEAKDEQEQSDSTPECPEEVAVPQQEMPRVDFFPFVEEAIKNDMVINIIVDTVVNDFQFIEDDPDVKSIFMYRFTGLPQFRLDKMPKIAWRINAMNRRKVHPGELLGLLAAVSKYEMFAKNVTYLEEFFSFCAIEGCVIVPHNYTLPNPPHPYISKGDKFRKVLRNKLKDYPSARRCFVQANTIDDE